MKCILNKIKESKGFISIETIVISGVIILIGAVSFIAFGYKANNVTDEALGQVDQATTKASSDFVKFNKN